MLSLCTSVHEKERVDNATRGRLESDVQGCYVYQTLPFVRMLLSQLFLCTFFKKQNKKGCLFGDRWSGWGWYSTNRIAYKVRWLVRVFGLPRATLQELLLLVSISQPCIIIFAKKLK